MEIVKKTLKTKAKIENWREISFKIKEFLQSLHILDNQIKNILIVCEEIFVNVSKYSYPDKLGDLSFYFEWQNNKRTLKIISYDCGIRFNPLNFKKSFNAKNLGGNGILMIKNLTDTQSYRFENGNNVFSLSKNFN